jgi:hypothetical protein
MSSWQPPAPTQAPLPAHVDGSRTSVEVKAIYEAAKALDMPYTDPTKVVKALTKFVLANRSCGLVDPAKRNEFFAWFQKHMEHSYNEYVTTTNNK